MKAKSKSKIIRKILAGVAGLFIIGSILMFYNAFNGNFITGMYYKSKVDKYIAETYPDKNYEVSSYSYEFKTGEYYFAVIDPDSEDGCFKAYYINYGKTVVDTYNDDVLHLNNTLMRLEKELRKELDPLIDSHLDTKEKNVDGEYVGGEFGYATCMIGDCDYDYLKDKLYLDMQVDVKNMPLPTEICVVLRSDGNSSFRRVKEMAIELKTLGYRIDYYDFSTNDKPYEMIPVGRLLDAQSIDDLEEFVMPYYDVPIEDYPENEPTTTHPTFSTDATAPEEHEN